MMMDDNKDQRLRRKRKLSDNGGKEQDSNGKPIDGKGNYYKINSHNYYYVINSRIVSHINS